ncbi:transcriptional regulator [Staphylococcus haemolyticus]|nr:transcriptional regulator [Staphylococcus haemolyticus]MCC3722445.1 transcriptional regulator [Staphylococcus haemolyticus]
MFKRILKIWFIIKLQSEDDVEVPKDFNEYDHTHLNDEVSR